MLRNVFISGFILLLTHSNTLFPQYYYEDRVTDKNFEESSLFFTSHYLHPFRMKGFQEVTPGLLDDPFLNLQLNPANFPAIPESLMVGYLDYRSERTEAVVKSYYRSYYLSNRAFDGRFISSPDPRWIQITRTEPEPIFSLGLLGFPFRFNNRSVFLGGTYQIIYRAEPFYSNPYFIFINTYGLDAFGTRIVSPEENIPIENRRTGEDEMLTTAHLLSGFLGTRILPELEAGMSFNAVWHSRDGVYSRFYKDEYGSPDNWAWLNFYRRDRDQDYSHRDVSAGLRYHPDRAIAVGLKLGYLWGTAEQSYVYEDSTLYSYNSQQISTRWNRSYSRSNSFQNWKHDGNSWYGRLMLSAAVSPQRSLNFYYRFQRTLRDVSTTSAIADTDFYASQGSWDAYTYYSRYTSYLKDNRNGWGERKKIRHQAALIFKWDLTPGTTVRTGVYYARNYLKINIFEPVSFDREADSRYLNTYYSPDTSRYYRREIHEKQMRWFYRNRNWTIQIPVFLHFKAGGNFGLLLGINRTLNYWKITDETLAIYSLRKIIKNSTVDVQSNFGERFANPDKRITEDFTDAIADLEISISPRFRINLLVNPEFQEIFRIAQWWLAFRAEI